MNAFSIFSGCGGLDIGIEQSGFNNIVSIELDKHAAASLENWKNIKGLTSKCIINDNIKNIDPNIFSNKRIDLLHGGPPCQAFSLIGKRCSLDDERGQLLFEVIRFAEILKPKAILLEQVKGLLSAPDSNGIKGGVFKLFLSELERINYTSKWSVLCAADYGVPQLRERVFIVATKGKNGFSFPSPTHSDELEDLTLFPLKPYVTVGEVIGDLPKPRIKNEPEVFFNHVDVTPERDIERISYVSEGSYLACSKTAPKDIIKNLTKKDTTKYKRLHRNEPSLTLRGGEIFFHPIENRYLTPREYMRIHTYPDEYQLMGPIRSRSGSVKDLDQHRQIANSVPPLLAKVIADEIIKVIS